jgi:hypothetical protein
MSPASRRRLACAVEFAARATRQYREHGIILGRCADLDADPVVQRREGACDCDMCLIEGVSERRYRRRLEEDEVRPAVGSLPTEPVDLPAPADQPACRHPRRQAGAVEARQKDAS